MPHIIKRISVTLWHVFCDNKYIVRDMEVYTALKILIGVLGLWYCVVLKVVTNVKRRPCHGSGY
jgi:hypothetical protein